MLSTLTCPPECISPEDHAHLTSSTPRSFTEIPPILRWLDEEVLISMSPLAPHWTDWTGHNRRVKGRLWVTELRVRSPTRVQAVSFLPEDLTMGFTFLYTTLTLHALTPASPSGVSAHLYCQLDESDAPSSDNLPTNGNGNGLEEQAGGVRSRSAGLVNGDDGEVESTEVPVEVDEHENEFTPMRELRIYLAEAKLQPLFAALSQCSALHASVLPGAEESGFFGFGDGPDEDEDDEGAFDDAEADGEGDGDGGRDEDPVETFLSRVEWGNVPKPEGWD
ncbi:MAG: hypothetical protein TREMPRED_001082 [Tremellales sp. Tagirdzhanova-0007]|nr:MAG: hypothetical protein TREMPRED_001082 [Tremellales sp. Tagirdzhanova-0007]